MAVGTHELLLIVRAQNQASAALGRVSRDLRRMSTQRDLEMRRAAIANRLARNSIQQQREMARIENVLSHDGAVRLQHQQALARNAAQQLSIQDRIAGLEVRRAAIARNAASIETQRMRLYSQELKLEQSLEKIELRRMGLNNMVGRLGTQQLRNETQLRAVRQQEYALTTQLQERQLRYNQARRRTYAAEKAGADAQRIADLRALQNIARRRVEETRMGQRMIPGKRAAIISAGGDIQADVRKAEATLETLKNEEKQVANAAQLLTSRHRELDLQLRSLDARTEAAAAAERALKTELKLTEDQVAILNARWEQHKVAMQQAAAQIEILQKEEAQLNMQLVEQNALLAGQSRERWLNTSRAVSHFGRVMQMTGLIATAAFGAMAVSAAHLNTEATRVATQTGPIGSGTAVIVRNAKASERAIIDLMKVVPANQQQLSDALYNIYSSMNVSFGGGQRLLKIFAQTWEAGGMLGDVNEVADALITLGNNWKIAGDDTEAYRRIAASTLATVRFGRLTVEQYTQTMNQLAPAFKGAHQSIEEMNGAIAFMTRLLPSQRMSAAGLARFMEIIGRFAAKPASGFEQLAKDIQDAQGNLKPLSEIMDIFIQQFPQLKTSGVFLNNFIKMISNLQGTVQARRALQGLVMQNELYDDTLKNTTGDVNEFSRSLRAMEQSTGVKWAQFINNMRALALEIGAAALPALTKFGEILNRAVKWFQSLDKSTRDNIATWAAYGAVLTLIGGVALTVLGSFAALLVSLRIIGGSRGIQAVSKAMGRGGAAGAARVMASDVGMLSIRMVAISSAIGAALLILIRFRHQVLEAANALGGFHTILKMISVLLTIWTVQTVINGLRSISTQADVATAAVGRTRTALVGLNGFTVGVLLSIGIIESPEYKAFRKWLKDTAGAPGDALFSNLGEAFNSFMKTGRHLYDLTLGFKQFGAKKDKEAEAARIKATINIATMWQWISQGKMGIADLKVYQPYMDPNDYKALMHHARMFAKPPPAGTTGSGTAGSFAAVGAGPSAAAMDAQMMKQVATVNRLREAYEKAPNPRNWRRWQNALSAATKDLTKDQKEMFDDLLSSFKKTNDDVKKISDAQALSMARNIKHLEDVANRTRSLKDFLALQKAQAAFDKVATADQQAAIQGLMSAEDQLAQKREQNAKEALDKAKEHAQKMKELHKQNMENAVNTLRQTTQSIQSMFEDSLSQQQQNFGQLFQGRYMTESANMKIKERFGIPTSASDLRRDLKMQVGEFTFFNNSLERLRKRGAPEELISQLAQMGPSAQKEINLLTSAMNPAQFRGFVRDFNRGQKEIQKAAERDLAVQIKKWNQYGRKVALAIINGVRSQNPELEDAIMAMVKRMFPGLTKQAGKLAPTATPGVVEHHHYDIKTTDARGVKTAIGEARFQYKNRKRPGALL